MAERRGPRSATDITAELEQDPDYRARRQARDAEIEAAADARRLACEPVRDDLREHGVSVESLYELYKQPESYPRAVPVLLSHLERDYPERVLDDIGNALPFNSKAAATWWDDFKRLYLTTRSDAVRDRLAAAMSQCGLRKYYNELLTFLGNEDLGESRIYFLRPVNHVGNRIQPGQGRAIIERLADHPVLGIESTRILQGRSRSQ